MFAAACSSKVSNTPRDTHITDLFVMSGRFGLVIRLKGAPRKAGIMWSIASPSLSRSLLHTLKEQQIGVQISEDFNLPMGKTLLLINNSNKKTTFFSLEIAI